MSSYCSATDVGYYLIPDHGQSANLETFIARASGLVDSILGGVYGVPLSDHDGTPPCPDVIVQATAKLAAHEARLADLVTHRIEETDGDLREQALEDLRDLVSSDSSGKLPPVTITGEVMTFPGTDPLLSDEWKFVHATRRIIPATVTISGMERGVDFVVNYHDDLRGWILTRIDSSIVTGSTVSYLFEWMRNDPEVTRDSGPTDIEVIRGG